MNTTERESPLKSPSKIRKSETENLRKKNPSKSRKSENILLQEQLADLQEIHMKTLEEAQDFVKTIPEEQCQMDAAEREKDRQFLLQLGNLFAQK